MESRAPGRPVSQAAAGGVVEVPGIGREWSVAQLGDGSLLVARKGGGRRLSRDGDASWGKEQELPDPVSAWGCSA